MTAGGAVPHRELESIEIVELIPEVVDAVRLLGNENRHIVDEPRTKLIVDDARHFLSMTTRTYDVIVSDLFVPWESETGYLYTVKQFIVARKHLRSGGLFCQWLPLYQLGATDFEMIADSLRSVFPHVTLWWGRLDKSRPILALIASENRLQVDEALMSQRLNTLSLTGQFDDSSLATPTRIRSNIHSQKVHPFRLLGRGSERCCFQNQKRRSNEQRNRSKTSKIDEEYGAARGKSNLRSTWLCRVDWHGCQL